MYFEKGQLSLDKGQKRERDRAEQGWVGLHLTGPRKVQAGVFAVRKFGPPILSDICPYLLILTNFSAKRAIVEI